MYYDLFMGWWPYTVAVLALLSGGALSVARTCQYGVLVLRIWGVLCVIPPTVFFVTTTMSRKETLVFFLVWFGAIVVSFACGVISYKCNHGVEALHEGEKAS